MCSENNLGCLSYCNIRVVETTIHIVKVVEEGFYIEEYIVICEKIMIFLLAKKIEIIYYYKCVSTRVTRVLIKKLHNTMRRLLFMLKPLGDRVVIELVQAEEKTASGIVLPDTAKEKPQEGKVIAVGTGRVLENGERVALEVAAGDLIIFSKYAGTEVKYEGTDYLILRESDILAVIG